MHQLKILNTGLPNGWEIIDKVLLMTIQVPQSFEDCEMNEVVGGAGELVQAQCNYFLGLLPGYIKWKSCMKIPYMTSVVLLRPHFTYGDFERLCCLLGYLSTKFTWSC